MDIKLTDKSLRQFLDTPSTPEELSHDISLCGPTFDRISKHGDNYLYEIEVITNRIDTASAQGVARDSAAILNQMGIKSTLKNDPYLEKINLYSTLPKSIKIEIKDTKLVPRFTAVSLENISIKDSPKDTQDLLTLCDERPINNAVDITNELTLLYGMPCHVFDQDKLATQSLTIRESVKGEKVTTLDDQRNELRGGDIVIEDGVGRLVDLCGVMGGQIAEVDKYTKNILLIVPVYEPKRIRKTSLYLQKRTLASQIYERQPDSELCLPVLTAAIKLLSERAGARVCSAVFDTGREYTKEIEITLNIPWTNSLIGQELSQATIISILESLGFKTKEQSKDDLSCTVPSWRRFDIGIKEDLVEEIARVYGYSKLQPVLPSVNLAPEPKDPILKTESKAKNYLSCNGYNEIYNNSLISLEQIEDSFLTESDHLKLTNALSKEFEYLRTSLVPSILQNIKDNQGKTDEPYRLYELSNIYLINSSKLPLEISKLTLTSTEEFRIVKGELDIFLQYLNLPIYKYQVAKNTATYFIQEETAEIIHNKKILGYIGKIKPAILHKMGITSNPVIVDLDIKSISDISLKSYVYTPIPEYPAVVEQVTVTSNDLIGEIIEKIFSVSSQIVEVIYTDSYKNKHSFKVSFASPKNNLSHQEVIKIKDDIQSLFS